MNRLRFWLRNVFGFSRSEANGFLILLPLMICILFSYPVFRALNPPQPFDLAETKRLDSLLTTWNFNTYDSVEKSDKQAVTLFPFDPNTVSVDQLQQLGFSPFMARRIHSYRAAGGKFSRPNDLLKIYGIDTGLFQAVAPYIVIETTERIHTKRESKTVAKLVPEKFDLNLADTAQLKTIRGIGSVFARRIINYRTSLGGFINPNQLAEVYGLDSAALRNTLDKVYVDESIELVKLDLNAATEKELASHPYIRSKLAKNIVAYRFQHGSFAEIDDLLKLDLIDSKKLEQIRPYLKIIR